MTCSKNAIFIMKKKELVISVLAQTSGPQYVLLLQELDGLRKLPIIIGSSEAQSIVMSLNSFSSPRPMTHDLFTNSLFAFGIVINEVVIVKVEDNIFYSELLCEQVSTGTKIRIDSRTSDAIALAVRFKCKIFVNEDVLESSGIDFSDIEQIPTDVDEKNILKKINELEKLLEIAIKEEKYEEASRIRDEINNLKDQI